MLRGAQNPGSHGRAVRALNQTEQNAGSRLPAHQMGCKSEALNILALIAVPTTTASEHTPGGGQLPPQLRQMPSPSSAKPSSHAGSAAAHTTVRRCGSRTDAISLGFSFRIVCASTWVGGTFHVSRALNLSAGQARVEKPGWERSGQGSKAQIWEGHCRHGVSLCSVQQPCPCCNAHYRSTGNVWQTTPKQCPGI